MNAHQISKIPLNPDVVDGIVFWTKNPIPMLEKLDMLRDYMYYFQFTLNSYAQDVETHIPSKQSHVIPAFKKLSDLIGPNRVIWRYDPILLNDTYTPEYHIRYFEKIAKELSPYTKKCTISFIDLCMISHKKSKEVLQKNSLQSPIATVSKLILAPRELSCRNTELSTLAV